MNIQFMSENQTRINKRGDKVYIPDYDALRENACCLDEVEAINRCEELFNRLDDGFAFQVVHTVFTEVMKQNLKTKEIVWKKEWTVYQHPWYRNYNELKGCYELVPKEDIVSEIAIEMARKDKMI